MELLVIVAIAALLLKVFGGLVGGVLTLLLIGGILEVTVLKSHREEARNIEYY